MENEKQCDDCGWRGVGAHWVKESSEGIRYPIRYFWVPLCPVCGQYLPYDSPEASQ